MQRLAPEDVSHWSRPRAHDVPLLSIPPIPFWVRRFGRVVAIMSAEAPRSGFDCSGLVQYVYGKLGIPLPHYTVSQYRHGHAVPRSRLRPGDLVFFSGLNHVGIYAGGGKYIHAPRAGTTVRWASLASHPGYYGARRIVAT